MEQHDRQRTYYEGKGYESVDSITKTSSGDLLLYMSKDFMKNVTASPEYQEKCRELGTAE